MASSFASPSSFFEKNDVFVSFRGEDTRGNFTSHLHAALERKSIKAFVDTGIQKGDEVWPTLEEAIENSRASIVVFSKDYASSKWCLEELDKILKCRKDQGQVVIPVFFEIDPSHVRKQSGSYGEAIAKHMQLNQNKVSQWKAALTKASNIAGWSCTPRDDQSKLIQNIVNDILQQLDRRYPHELKGLVGIDENQSCIESLLKEVSVVGIWGMGGIGKTTLAKAVFAKLSSQYVSCCFLENVREEFDKRGLNHLRDRLRSQLLGQESMGSSDDVTWLRRLGYKKVLIVLDDVSLNNVNVVKFVDEVLEQLNFGQTGSRFIITARDKDLLAARVNEIHEVKELNRQDSLKLFCLNAFKKTSPNKGYEELSQRTVDYVKGVPLAIKVLGSLLGFKDPKVWECKLKELQKHPDERVQRVLRLSYDELNDRQKNIFLDIAFFFKGEDKDVTTRILHACGFYATSGIDTLLCKALVTISVDNRIQMHDLIQAMGLEIVREKSIEDPGRRTRLKDIEEVCDVLTNNKGTDVVEGIMLNVSQITRDLYLSADTFTKMPNLRFLKFYLGYWTERSCTVYLPPSLESFPVNLSYLHWDKYPLKSLPSTFSAEKLVELRMRDSHVTKLWDGVQDLVNLRTLDLEQCKELRELPDFSKASKLKHVYLFCCESLLHVHPSILSLVNLRTIDLCGCKQLRELPDFSKASKLKRVDLSFCESLLHVHPSILSLDSLKTLDLRCCVKLRSLKSDTYLRSLKYLELQGCESLKEFSVSSKELRDLDLLKTGIEKWNSSLIAHLQKLKRLTLTGLTLENLPVKELCCLRNLKSICLCDSKHGLDKSNLCILFNGLQFLRELTLKECKTLSELPNNIGFLPCLWRLDLSESSIKSLPESIKHLPRLRRLDLSGCSKLCSLPELPQSIRKLDAKNCTSLKTVFTLKRRNWECISFQNCKNLEEDSVRGIIEDVHVICWRAAMFGHSFSRWQVYTDGCFCLPGDRVPKWFRYSARQASIAVKLRSLSHLLGFVLCVVLSRSPHLDPTNIGLHIYGSNGITCLCYTEEGKMIGGGWEFYIDIQEITSHHVCLLYCQNFGNRILEELRESETNYQCNTTGYARPKVSFKFRTPFYIGINISECGICPIYISEYSARNNKMVPDYQFLYELDATAMNVYREGDWKREILGDGFELTSETDSKFQFKSQVERKGQAMIYTLESDSETDPESEYESETE